MVLDASGYYVVRVNGEPRGGEKYGMDWVRHPVRLNKGRNTFLFQGERGRIRARLFDPPAPVFFVDSDATLPDIVRRRDPRALGRHPAGQRHRGHDRRRRDLRTRPAERRGTAVVRATIPPLTARKLPIPIEAAGAAAEGAVQLTLTGRARARARALSTCRRSASS